MTTTQYTIDGFGNALFASTKQVKQIVNGSITPGSVVVGDLDPNLPVKTDGNKKLVSGLISEEDLDFSVLTNPLTAEMTADGFLSTGVNEVKTRFLQDNGGGLYGVECKPIFKCPLGLRTTSIRHTSPGSDVRLDDNVDCNNLQLRNCNSIQTSTLSTQAGLGGDITVIGGPINLNANSLTNVNNTQTESISNTLGTLDVNLADAVLSINRPSGGNTILSLTEIGNNPFNIRKSGVVDDICAEGTDELHLTTDCFLGVKKVILSPNTNTMLLRDYSLDMNNNDIINCNDLKTDNLTSSTTTEIKMNSDLNLNGQNIIGLDLINGIQPSGGLYSESSGFSTASTTEIDILAQGASSGSLSIPANTFSALSMYSFKASGVLSGGTNDLFTLRANTLTSIPSTVLLGEIMVTLQDNGLVDVPWDIMIDFTVRNIGIAGTASLVLSGAFRYNNNNDVVRTFLRTVVLNTGFDTTIDNTLQLTFQNDGTNPLTSFRIDQASFTKWY